MTVDEQISEEVKQYVSYCQKACEHDALEHSYRLLAHKLFYHIQELRSTRVCTPFAESQVN